MNLASDFLYILRNVCEVRTADTVLVALSGGADSVAMLRLMLEVKQPIAAVHCNFHLRGEESDRDERFCRQLCEHFGVTLHVEHFDTAAEAKQSGESIEMAARRLRYDLFARLCEDNGYTAVAVAHHKDDNIETILLNIVRGTGLNGLTGMRFRRDNVIRPLLKVTHAEILAYLESIHQDYVVDSTNADTHFKRNFIRHRVLPLLRELNPSFDAALMRLQEHVTDALDICITETSKEQERAFSSVPHGVNYDLRELNYHESFRIFNELYGFSNDAVERLIDWQSLSERAVFESKEYTAVVRDGTLEITRRPTPLEPVALPGNGIVPLPDGGCLRLTMMDRAKLDYIPHEDHRVALDADCLGASLVYRAATPDDRFIPFGMNCMKSVHNFLKQHHISAPRRQWARVIADELGPVWLMGWRPSRRAIITEETRRVLLIEHTYAPKFPEN